MKGHLIALAPLLSGLISQSNSVYLLRGVYFKKSSWALRPGGPNKMYDAADNRHAGDASHLIGQMFRLKCSSLLHGALTTPLAVHDSWQGYTLLCYLMSAWNTHPEGKENTAWEYVTRDMWEKGSRFITSVGSVGYKTLLMFLGSVKCLTTFGVLTLLTTFPWRWQAEDDIIVSFPAHTPCAWPADYLVFVWVCVGVLIRNNSTTHKKTLSLSLSLRVALSQSLSEGRGRAFKLFNGRDFEGTFQNPSVREIRGCDDTSIWPYTKIKTFQKDFPKLSTWRIHKISI